MFTAKIENANGSILTLTGKEAVYQVIGIIGLNPPNAQINTTTIVGMDGAMFNSSKLETRNLVLTVRINGDVEQNRLALYTYFRTKDWCKFYYSNDSLNVYIEGYVESVECDLFSNGETAQISIICPYPYFRSMAETVVNSSNSIAAFTFPFAINLGYPIPISEYADDGYISVYNSSQVETGAIIEINVNSDCSSIELLNATTNNDLILEYAFLAGDKITINTNKGQKGVQLLRNGTFTNILFAVKAGSSFIQFGVGNNAIEYLVDGDLGSDAVFLIFRYFATYRGV